MSNTTVAFNFGDNGTVLGLLIFAICSVVLIIVIATWRFGCENEIPKRRVTPQECKGDIYRVSMYMSRVHINLLDFNQECFGLEDKPKETHVENNKIMHLNLVKST